MANQRSKTTKTRRRGSEQLTKADPRFYDKLGSLGGNATFKAHGSEHFRLAALASHEVRRKNAAERAKQEARDER